MSRCIRIGSRGSNLALIQAKQVQCLLLEKNPRLKVDIIIIQTEGDCSKKPISEIGGKGVFIKSLQAALLNNQIDIAVHSFKDMTSSQPANLQISGALSPEAIEDCLVLKNGTTLAKIPMGSKLGTGSLRRKALLKKLRPDIEVVPIRGNVETRLSLIEKNGLYGVVLSKAGLIRLNKERCISVSLDPNLFLPAPGQGVIALETRRSDSDLHEVCYDISNPKQYKISLLEYQFLKLIGFDCSIPLGLLTTLNNNKVSMKGFISNNNASRFYEKEISFSINEAELYIKTLTNDFLAFRAII